MSLFLIFWLGLKIENNNPPIIAPYKLLLIGLEVITQVPVAQPTYFQYKKPAMLPAIAPVIINKLLLNHLIIFIWYF